MHAWRKNRVRMAEEVSIPNSRGGSLAKLQYMLQDTTWVGAGQTPSPARLINLSQALCLSPAAGGTMLQSFGEGGAAACQAMLPWVACSAAARSQLQPGMGCSPHVHLLSCAGTPTQQACPQQHRPQRQLGGACRQLQALYRQPTARQQRRALRVGAPADHAMPCDCLP